MFIGHAEQQGWCSSGIRATVPRPRVPNTVGKLSIPLWDDIRRFIASIPDFKAADLRAKALFLLFSVYGLRSAEVRGLTLEDIDWFRGSLIVHRAKRGKTQQLPLQPEVGDAIALYLEKARPKCRSRVVFVTLTPPHRPITKASMHHLISDRLKTAGIAPQGLGPHMLRRACATQLLRTGSPLQEIADFLGHSNLKSVSHYARFDPASLQHVAEFSLQGLL